MIKLIKNLWSNISTNWHDTKLAESVIPVAVSIVTEFNAVSISKEYIRTQVSIRTRKHLNDNQLNILLKLLVNELYRHGVQIKIDYFQIWIIKQEMAVR